MISIVPHPTMSDEKKSVGENLLLREIFQQHAENARHIKSERVWFMSFYCIIDAGSLSLPHSTRSEAVLEYSPILFMLTFLLVSLLTSFGFNAQLEECLRGRPLCRTMW